MAHILLQVGLLEIHLASIAFIAVPSCGSSLRQADNWRPASPVSSPLCMSGTRLQNPQGELFRKPMNRTGVLNSQALRSRGHYDQSSNTIRDVDFAKDSMCSA